MSQISLPFNTHTFNTHNGKHVVFYGQRDNWGEGSLPIRWHDGEPVMGFKVGRWLRSLGNIWNTIRRLPVFGTDKVKIGDGRYLLNMMTHMI